MSDTILSGKLTVYYLDENRQKRIDWTGTTAKSDTQKMISVYDATEDLMTQPTQQNDGLIFSAETPGEYTVGKIDAGEIEPWFISLKTMEHVIGDFANFTGCALKTSGWTRDLPGDGTGNTGIVVVPVTAASNNILITDVGSTITHADGDSGTLLDVVYTGGTTDYLWIRPASNALANDFNSTSLNLTVNARTAPQTAAAITGEMVWGNFYSQGALVNDTHVYLLQGGSKVTSSDETDQDYWIDGHVDRAIPITDYTTASFPTIDEGYLTVRACQYGTKYSYAIIRMNSTSGGNVSAGLSSGADITNTTGYASITMTAVGTDDFSVGDEIEGATSGARGIITQIDGASPTYTFHHYLIGDPLTVFQTAAETITNNDATGSATKNASAPASQGPALTTWFDGNLAPTYTFGHTTQDIDDDGTGEGWSLRIDMNQASLAQLHEHDKYAMRRGSVFQLDGVDGEQWIGFDYAINYSAFTATIAEGDVATQAVTGATGTVVSFPGGTSNVMILRNSRGTFDATNTINFTSGGNISGAQVTSVEIIVPVAESSFGTVAGVNFFGSRGVLLDDYKTAEENLFSLIDSSGTPRARPTSISVNFGNLKQHDYVSAWRLTGTGGSIDKTEYSASGGETPGVATLDIDTTINADVPGKTAGGTLVLRDATDQQEYVLRYSSYDAATGTVTLANAAFTAGVGTDTDTVAVTGIGTAADVGDLVLNTTRANAVSYVTEVTDADTVQIFPPITGQTSTDAVELNAVPIAVNTADDIYFAVMFQFRETDGSYGVSMQYVGDFYARGVVRNTSGAAVKIKGFTTEIAITTAGGSATATRIPNTVYGS